ncbi:GntR family transcriptional regulator [Thermoactinomyces sp. DSM 45892]|uniref:GntR family transcriptional regulator n=1 Tax=Thermoactinomyces sp. DSM 45892 TaxID=1882753 RepID=UPI00089BF7A1|nr:GntR family transcriptional regulator [Thermoactinomyces sp. DSM 45892]SDZ36233.1 transcriptional regulator, GntR family [Thermoactinomyces sp. DSM 45892]
MEKNTKIDEVVETIRQRINESIYVSGQQLPSERYLSEEFGVSRGTIRAALLRLQAEGLVDVVPRGGIFVKSTQQKQKMDPMKSGNFISQMRKQGRKVISRYLEETKKTPAGSEIAGKMGIIENCEVILRHRIQIVDGLPYRIIKTYLLTDLAEGLLGKDDQQIPLFDLLKSKNFHPTRASETINCRIPTKEEAKQLNISNIAPIIEIDRLLWGIYSDTKDTEVLFEYSKIICNASLNELHYNYDINTEKS